MFSLRGFSPGTPVSLSPNFSTAPSEKGSRTLWQAFPDVELWTVDPFNSRPNFKQQPVARSQMPFSGCYQGKFHPNCQTRCLQQTLFFQISRQVSISFPEPALPLSRGTGTRGSGIKRFRSQSHWLKIWACAVGPVVKSRSQSLLYLCGLWKQDCFWPRLGWERTTKWRKRCEFQFWIVSAWVICGCSSEKQPVDLSGAKWENKSRSMYPWNRAQHWKHGRKTTESPPACDQWTPSR